MDFSINHWNELTNFMNGFVLSHVSIFGNNLVGINSNGEKFNLATRTPIFWTASYGKSFEAIDLILRKVKPETIGMSQKERDAFLEKRIEEIIKLFEKEY